MIEKEFDPLMDKINDIDTSDVLHQELKEVIEFMFKEEKLKELDKKIEEQDKLNEEKTPLSHISTTQLKAELRRRKKSRR